MPDRIEEIRALNLPTETALDMVNLLAEIDRFHERIDAAEKRAEQAEARLSVVTDALDPEGLAEAIASAVVAVDALGLAHACRT